MGITHGTLIGGLDSIPTKTNHPRGEIDKTLANHGTRVSRESCAIYNWAPGGGDAATKHRQVNSADTKAAKQPAKYSPGLVFVLIHRPQTDSD